MFSWIQPGPTSDPAQPAMPREEFAPAATDGGGIPAEELNSGLAGPPARTATCVLIALNVLVFVAMVFSGVSAFSPQGEQLVRWGANSGPLTIDLQWWRLLTSTFVHIGLLHLALNMWCLWSLGSLGEELYGPWVYTGLYLLAGVAGSLASIWRHPGIVSAGASGAIFGLAGALIATFKLGNLPLPPAVLRTMLRSLVAFAGYNLMFGMLYPGIDNAAHVGGLVCGLLLGAALSRTFGHGPEPRHASTALLAFSFTAVLLTGAAFELRHSRAPAIRVNRARMALTRRDLPAAQRALEEALRIDAHYAPAHEALADTYLVSNQPLKAESEYQQALVDDPSSLSATKKLAAIFAGTQRAEAAIKLLNQAVQRHPEDPELFFELGALQNDAGHTSEAVDALKRSAALRPDVPGVQYALGLSNMQLRQYDEAIKNFSKAISLTPDSVELYMALSNAYEAKGMRREADEAYSKAYQLRQAPHGKP
ncbi:MAG TPA: rhomboid family intramembrane serine protease [Terriglobales bacterium]|nr:rhomboid family intramembrane serine protease [Terriglobales bacterium]